MKENKITSVTLKVSYKGAGNVVRQQDVSFDIYQEGETYKAVPTLSEAERRIANLPPELRFQYQEGKTSSSRGAQEGNLNLLLDITEALKAKGIL